MDIFEFELRYRAYSGLLAFFQEDATDDMLISLLPRTSLGALETKLVETSIEQLREATRKTYTLEKIAILKTYASQSFKGKTKADYLERLEYELKVIFEMGYNTYFLIVRDYIHRAKSHQIMVGPGRGSVAGSLLSYVLGITDLDPLEFDLIFERFLNPGRISMPDIDTDFEDTLRDKVIEYIRERYGKENVAHIGTYMTLAAKAAFKDVARVLGIKFDQANKLSGLITGKTIQDSVDQNKDLQEAIKADTRIEKVIDIARQLEGTVRQTGVHACGMIIAPAPVITYSPIQYPPKSGSKELRDESRIVSQYEGPIIETLGLLKMDILGLRNLSIIKHTAKIIHARAKATGKEPPAFATIILQTMSFHPPVGDALAYAVFAAGDTSGVFQFESDGMRGWLRKLKPNCFDDLIAMVALYRPGPMEFIPAYIDRKHGIEEVSYMQSELYTTLERIYGASVAKEEKHKLLEDLGPFMQVTYGIAIYQEQLMRLVQAMAGFSMAEADNLRKGVGKKIREVIEKIKVEFVKRAESYRGYKQETAIRIYEKMIEPAADYSFNKSHAACYAYISYQTAWLKAHYPLEFHAALLRSVENDPEKLAGFIQEVQLQGVPVLPPQINTSFEHVAAIEDHLEIGFLGIKGIGSEIASHLEQERLTSGPFDSLGSFLTRCASLINKKTLESLVKSGALDCFGTRQQLVTALPEMLEWAKQQQTSAGGGLFGGGLFGESLFTLPEKTAYDEDILFSLRMEKEVFNVALSAHPLDGLFPRCRAKYNFVAAVNVENFGEFRLCVVVLGINKGMRGGYFLQVEDITGQLEFYMQEKVDVEPFDILLMTGYKGQRFPKIDTIRVVSLRSLQEKAKQAGLFDPDKTVASVRKSRKQEQLPEPTTHHTEHQGSAVLEEEESDGGVGALDDSVGNMVGGSYELHISDNDDSSSETVGSVLGSGDNTAKSDQEVKHFQTPEDMRLLMKIPHILKQYPGDIPVAIGTKYVLLSSAGVVALEQLLDGV